MNDLTGYILSLCNTLSADNKVPSVATIRNKSARPLPLPDVIRVLKMWQDNPNQSIPEKKVIRRHDQTDDLAMRLDRLENQMASIFATLKTMQIQLDRLSADDRSE